jgi:hypothetical protein
MDMMLKFSKLFALKILCNKGFIFISLTFLKNIDVTEEFTDNHQVVVKKP